MSQGSAARAADAGLSVAAVAARLGVAPATLRTWDRRYGLGPSQHAAGSHRRYSAGDVERLERMRRLVIAGIASADAARAVLADADVGIPDVSSADDDAGMGDVVAIESGTPSARGLVRAAQALDGQACRDIVARTLDRRGVVWTWDHLVVPVLVTIGRKWQETGNGIEVEHVLSEAIQAELSSRIDDDAASSPGCVLLACAEGDMHSLPLWAVGAALSERRVAVRMLGAQTPVAALAQAMRRIRPGAVFVWSQIPGTGDAVLLDDLPDLRPEPAVLLGGPGWSAERGFRRVGDLPEAVAALARAAGA